ncbi:hypothetical protein PLUTE_a4434 [Pseudoalteromonas luteoviolacea DSM 6061]|nr:hypothetical protein [Pseudoalteromonas luteoviolacea DSM 6061]
MICYAASTSRQTKRRKPISDKKRLLGAFFVRKLRQIDQK